MFKALILLLIVNAVKSMSETRTVRCDLVAANSLTDESFICKIDDLDSPRTNISIVSTGSAPLGIDSRANLVWLNRYQPAGTRWSQLCSSSSRFHSSMIVSAPLCANGHECDATGLCRLELLAFSSTDSSSTRRLTLELKDTIDSRGAEPPKFPADMRLLNVTWDLERSGAQHELLVLDRTDRLDALRSKPNRMLIKFGLENLHPDDAASSQMAAPHNCRGVSRADIFSLRYDNNAEKLYLILNNSRINEFKKGMASIKSKLKNYLYQYSDNSQNKNRLLLDETNG